MSYRNVTPNTATSSPLNDEQQAPVSDRLSAIRARLDAATPGPWADDYKSWCVWAPNHDLNEREERCLVAEVGCGPDTDLIAHAPADIAWLLDEVDARDERIALLRAEVADLEGLRG